MKQSNKCTCGLGNKMYCKNCSKVRVVILLKNGHDQLKVRRGNGEEFNPVWYSFLKYNRYDVYRIAEKIEENVRKHPQYSTAANVLQFYINGQRQAFFKKVPL